MHYFLSFYLRDLSICGIWKLKGISWNLSPADTEEHLVDFLGASCAWRPLGLFLMPQREVQ